MKSKLNAILATTVIAFSLAGHVQAQQAASAQRSGEASVASATDFTEGEVRKVDKEAKKVTIKHGEIKNLEMPPMTMVFAVKDDAVLGTVKVGDKVLFKAMDAGGKLIVTELQAVSAGGAAPKAAVVAQQAAAPAVAAPVVTNTPAVVGFTEGEVRKVDKGAKKVTIKHGEIKNLDMPPMTMVFAVKNDAALDKVKVGDKVQFKAISKGGKLTVIDIQVAK